MRVAERREIVHHCLQKHDSEGAMCILCIDVTSHSKTCKQHTRMNVKTSKPPVTSCKDCKGRGAWEL